MKIKDYGIEIIFIGIRLKNSYGPAPGNAKNRIVSKGANHYEGIISY